MTGVKHTKTVRGFTVMELLVVVLLFSVGMIAISAIYINFTRLHRRTANAEALGEEMRFAMELMVRAARNNTIQYPALPAGIPSPSDSMTLISRSGAITTVQLFSSGESVCSGLNSDCLGLSLDNGVTWAPITGKNIQVDRFDVYVYPEHSPFQTLGIGSYQNNEQPRVTFVIDAQYLGSHARETASMSLQTTVGSRLYIR